MDNALYVGLSKQMTLRRDLDIVANNIANMDTAGFKLESLMTRTEPARPARTLGGPAPVKFVADAGVARDFKQGALTKTGATFDLGLEGQGFFEVTTPDGPRYTRDGRFTLDPNGRLVTQGGNAVSGEGGGEIVVDPAQGEVQIGQDGSITQAGQRLGKVSVVRFADLAALSKTGDNLLQNTTNIGPLPAPDTVVRQGMLESSNVQPVLEITRLIQITRAYDSITRMMEQTSDLSRRSVERLGKAA